MHLLRYFWLLFCLAITGFSTAQPADTPTDRPVAIAIHGGAGNITAENLSASKQKQYKAALKKAVRTGHRILQNGGTAVEAVEASIRVMEDSPLFNSGKGAVMAHDGKHYLDASIMDGRNLNAGAVAGATDVKNPITAARLVMQESEHVMLSGAGVSAFAKANPHDSLKLVPNDYFSTPKAERALKRSRQKEKNAAQQKMKKHGTVGCVALDSRGHLAAGTSTGGMTAKKYGRIGDSPIIGAGTYADDKTCAVSSTGHGEYFIRGVIAHDISAQIEYLDATLRQAVRNIIHSKLTRMGGTGGVIAIDGDGDIYYDFNTPGMFRASIDKNNRLTVAMFQKNNN